MSASTAQGCCGVVVDVVQLLSGVRLFVTSWTAAHQVLLSSTVSRSLLKFMSIELVMLYNYLIFYHPLLLLPSIFPSIPVVGLKGFKHNSVGRVMDTGSPRNCERSLSNSGPTATTEATYRRPAYITRRDPLS